MNTTIAFILGLLIGWLVEWVIDYFYWRKRCAERVAAAHAEYRSKAPISTLEEPVEEIPPDNLQVIKGIGPVIERKLNEAGIYTFRQLGELTPADLERILGDIIERLANEDSILQQARDLAGRG